MVRQRKLQDLIEIGKIDELPRSSEGIVESLKVAFEYFGNKEAIIALINEPEY